MTPIPTPSPTKTRQRPQFAKVNENGVLVVNANKTQSKMLLSRKRRILYLGGTRSGKTSSAIFWLYNKIREMGPGDYLIVAPTFQILSRGARKEVDSIFKRAMGLGYFRGDPDRFVISSDGEQKIFKGTDYLNDKHRPETTIYMVHGSDPHALEAITAKAAWLDEAGQPEFLLESWEAIERRLSIDQGPALVTSTPYNWGWIKTRLYDLWKPFDDKDEEHPYIDVIRAKSIDNPAFPEEEYWRQKELMPFWRWDMMYNANFTLPSGLVYDCVPALEPFICVDPFDIPESWARYCGIDFGGINTAAVFAAQEPESGIIYIYRTYHPGKAFSIEGHVRGMMKGEAWIDRCAGGSASEGNWRDEFYEHGMTIEAPAIKSVDVGIMRVYGMFRALRVRVFKTLTEFWDEMHSYSYKTDGETGLPTPDGEILNQNKYHLLDATRYLGTMFPEMSGKFVASSGMYSDSREQSPDESDPLLTAGSAVTVRMRPGKTYTVHGFGVPHHGAPPMALNPKAALSRALSKRSR